MMCNVHVVHISVYKVIFDHKLYRAFSSYRRLTFVCKLEFSPIIINLARDG